MRCYNQRILSRCTRAHFCTNRRPFASASKQIAQVPTLSSWNLEDFQAKAFNASAPHRLPCRIDCLLPASVKWFVHNGNPTFDLTKDLPVSSELLTSFWADHKETLVPLELTSKDTRTSNGSGASTSTFHRSEAPLKLLLTYLGNARSPNSSILQDHSIYLAQCSLGSLPDSLQADLPTPSLVMKAGKGDIYNSSLWLGRSPTYTPLHRDPNPNLFLQLAGSKVVRLLPPEVGDSVFEHIQEQLRARDSETGLGRSSAAVRGEEMMAGPEREMLHRAVWEADASNLTALVIKYGQETEVGLGEALFIPKGWWHSVKGVGSAVTASVNWWFR